MFQGPQESLKEWRTQFSVEVVATNEISDKEALMGAMSSMRHVPFRDDLHQKPAKDTISSWKERKDSLTSKRRKAWPLRARKWCPIAQATLGSPMGKRIERKSGDIRGTQRVLNKLEGDEIIDMITTRNSALTMSLEEVVSNPSMTLIIT